MREVFITRHPLLSRWCQGLRCDTAGYVRGASAQPLFPAIRPVGRARVRRSRPSGDVVSTANDLLRRTRHHRSTRHTSSRSKNGTHRDPNPTSTYPVKDGSRNARTISARRLSMRNRLAGTVLTQSSWWTPLARTPVPGPTSMVATTSFVLGSISETVLLPSSRTHMARPSLTIFHAVASILPMTCIVSGSTRKTPSSQWATHTEDGVFRVDPDTMQVIGRIDATAWKIVSDGRAMWVLDEGKSTVSEIDPSTNEVVATIDVGPGTGVLARGVHEELWVRTIPNSLF